MPRSQLAAFLGVCLAFCVPAFAQITTATVTGTVKDAQGGVLPGATVTLINDQQRTRSVPAITNGDGDFVFPNVAPGSYTIEIQMPSFKTLERTGIEVSPGSPVPLGTLTLEVGGRSEVVDVHGDTSSIQSRSGERSFIVSPQEVESLPLSDRNFATLASLAPGVDGTSRIGGGGATNFMMDGVGTMDTGSNRLLMAVNVESIAQVKVLTSSYQAEFGRSSGLQITAVTKGGTNQFRGSAYDVERNSRWNANLRTNILNGDPKPVSKQRDMGFSVGGPIGKPGGQNKLFFYFAMEFQPRTQGNDVVRYRMPTALERAGDFSQTTDNNGNPYPYIRDTATGRPCSSSNTSGCFQDGGVLGRIPADRLYLPGVNILKMYPMPTGVTAPGQPYNFELTRPTEHLLAYQPALRVDYQPLPRLRVGVKYTGWIQRKQPINGSIPGWNDTLMQNPRVSTTVATATYNLTQTMFLEGTVGRSGNELAGCALTGNGPSFCTSAIPVDAVSNRIQTGLGDIPYLFPNATVLDPKYYAFGVMQQMKPPLWDGARLQLTPSFNWNGRVSNTSPFNYSPPSVPYPGFLNINTTTDVSASLTKLAGRHTIKAGFFNTHSYKAQQRGGWQGTITFSNDGNNPLDSQFPFANAALGIFDAYNQASKYVEGVFVYNNTEGFVQDNWRVGNRLTLDYGVRLVHQQPQYDALGQASNFLPSRWSPAQAPALYLPMCAGNAPTCTLANREARDPLTGASLGPNSVLAIGTIVAGSGNPTDGLFLSGQGISKTTYRWPRLKVAPRFGMAYDVTGRQRLVLRGGAGLFFDRPDGNSIYSQVQNPPTYKNITVRYGSLTSLGSGGLTTEGPPALSVYQYDSGLPSSWQWNAGMQIVLPWATALDISYVGHHSYNLLESVNLNAVDYGAAFLPANQDPTLAPSNTPGATAVSQDLMRPYRGYASIDQQWARGWQTFHSMQLSMQRRFRNGVSFGFNDTIALSYHQSAAARIQHAPDGSLSLRADQAEADQLLGTTVDRRHTLKGNFIFEPPRLRSSHVAVHALASAVNDWRLSGIWTGLTGTPYTIGYSYQNGGGNVNITGSPDRGARIRIVGDAGRGCSGNVYEQFNPSAFQGPLYNSVGLESGNGYLRSCFLSTLDLSVARTIHLGSDRTNRTLQLRIDVFNAPNSAIVTARATTINLRAPNDPVTITNLPYFPDGTLNPTRSRPRGAGVGVATGYQNARSVQLQARVGF